MESLFIFETETLALMLADARRVSTSIFNDVDCSLKAHAVCVAIQEELKARGKMADIFRVAERMFVADNPMAALCKVSAMFVKGELTTRDYVDYIRSTFANDSGEDWLDQHDGNPVSELRRLAIRIAKD